MILIAGRQLTNMLWLLYGKSQRLVAMHFPLCSLQKVALTRSGTATEPNEQS